MEDQYVWLTDLSKQFLEKDYLREGQTVDERVDEICNNAERILNRPGFAAAFKANIKKGWYSLSTPVWTNFGHPRGLPISCFGSYIDDTMSSILFTTGEVGMMSKFGGGTSGYYGKVRGRGKTITDNGTSYGSAHFTGLSESVTKIVSQGSTRRGSFAGYQDVNHPDIEEWLEFRTEGNAIQDLSYGINIPDDWMGEMIAGDSAKRKIWAKILQSRANTGYPYIIFIDNANNKTVDVYKKEGRRINQSNLCTEIFLPNNVDESFVCCLSSMNIYHYDAWKNTNAVELMVYFMDAVMSEFIEKTGNLSDPLDKFFMSRAHNFAKKHRAIGIGWLGWHSFLQRNMIPWESEEAESLNIEVASTIEMQAYAASSKMALEYGEPEVLKGYGRRHTTLLAIAPTKSSAFIMGQVSEGIEPHRANLFIKDLAKGKFTIKNHELEALLETKGLNNDEIWDSILKNAGSVQHLDALSEKEKAVFKTFREISPQSIIKQGADRTMFLDQGQSMNLIISPTTSPKDVSQLYINAWQLGIKSVYYQISVNAAQEFSRTLECVACEA